MSKKFNKKKKGNKGNWRKGGNSHEERRSERFASKSDRDNLDRDFSGTANDPSYYMGDPELVALSANLPSLHIEGTPLKTEFDGTQEYNLVYGSQERSQFMVPSICAIKYVPTMGQATRNTSPVNKAFDMTYNLARKYDSSLASYDAANLAIYAGSVINAHLAVRFAIKVFKSMLTYQRFNYATPNIIIQALGGNPSGFDVEEITKFQGWLKIKCSEVNRVFFPIAFPAIKRMTSVIDMTLVDTNAARAQYYTFAPQGFFYFDKTTEPWSLNFRRLPSNFTMESLMEYVDQIIEDLYSNPDHNLISAGLLKAFKMSPSDMLYTDFDSTPLEFKYDQNMLMQINNACAHGSVDTLEGLRYEEDATKGGLRFNPTFTGIYTNRLNTSGWVLNTDVAPTPELAMYVTRLVTNIKKTGDDSGQLTSFGTEILTGFSIYYAEDVYDDKPAYGVSWQTQNNLVAGDITSANVQYLMQLREATSNFDYAPKYSVALLATGVFDSHLYPESRDMRNYFYVSQDVLDQMNDVATLNLWDGSKMLEYFLKLGSSSNN